MIKEIVKEFIKLKKVLCMKDYDFHIFYNLFIFYIGKMIRDMNLDVMYLKMGLNMKESIRMVKELEGDFLLSKMEKSNMMEILKYTK